RPNLDLIRDTEINFDKGVLVDNNLKTNIDNIFAAGDVIEVNGKVIGLWTSSNEQGKIAGENMTGRSLKYIEPRLFTSLQLGDIKLFSVGNINEYTKIYEYKDTEKDVQHKLFVTDNKLTGAIL